MIGPPARPRRPRSTTANSQSTLELALTVLGILAALLLLRALFRLASVPDRVWSGQTLYALTDPFVLPLELIPGGSRIIAGDATLAEITVAALVFLIPAFLLSRRRPR
jgi:uncharacterized protein YggT (Ycf19 family)